MSPKGKRERQKKRIEYLHDDLTAFSSFTCDFIRFICFVVIILITIQFHFLTFVPTGRLQCASKHFKNVEKLLHFQWIQFYRIRSFFLLFVFYRLNSIVVVHCIDAMWRQINRILIFSTFFFSCQIIFFHTHRWVSLSVKSAVAFRRERKKKKLISLKLTF